MSDSYDPALSWTSQPPRIPANATFTVRICQGVTPWAGPGLSLQRASEALRDGIGYGLSRLEIVCDQSKEVVREQRQP